MGLVAGRNREDGSGIAGRYGDVEPHAGSETEPLQIPALVFEIVERVRLEYGMRKPAPR